jgi:hypothetical protein
MLFRIYFSVKDSPGIGIIKQQNQEKIFNLLCKKTFQKIIYREQALNPCHDR